MPEHKGPEGSIVVAPDPIAFGIGVDIGAYKRTIKVAGKALSAGSQFKVVAPLGPV